LRKRQARRQRHEMRKTITIVLLHLSLPVELFLNDGRNRLGFQRQLEIKPIESMLQIKIPPAQECKSRRHVQTRMTISQGLAGVNANISRQSVRRRGGKKQLSDFSVTAKKAAHAAE